MLKYLFVLLPLLWSYIMATNVTHCHNGAPLPLSVNIEGCDEPPCDVFKNETAIMRIHFVSTKNNIRSLTTQVKAKVIGLTVPYPLPDKVADVCSNLMYGAICPIYKTEDVVYQFNFFVENIFPEILVSVDISLVDDSHEPITCFTCDIKVKSRKARKERNQVNGHLLLLGD
uniref:MD-2-related lipid-recognition domain-containing protein n=1 Tax=Glossina brevipalpis TaxID=37001 RepID=A0A1A9X415_9MUSC